MRSLQRMATRTRFRNNFLSETAVAVTRLTTSDLLPKRRRRLETKGEGGLQRRSLSCNIRQDAELKAMEAQVPQFYIITRPKLVCKRVSRSGL
jgi:hypothetical protein